jgi:hypothetical protein
MNDFLLALVGILIGGAITAFVSRYYYQRASQDLREEADKLVRKTEDVRLYVDALISYLEAAGQAKVTRDAEDRPIKVQFLRGGGIASAPSVGGGTITQTQPEEPEESGPPQRGEEGGA